MSDRLALKFKINPGLLKEDVKKKMIVTVNHDRKTILRDAFDEISSAYLKQEYSNTQKITATLEASGEQADQEFYGQSLDELGIKDNDIIIIEKREFADGCFPKSSTTQGKISVMNQATKSWNCFFTHQMIVPENIPESIWGFTTPTVPIPAFGDCTLGSFERAKGKVKLNLENLDKNPVAVKNFDPNMKCDVYYPNFNTSQDPMPVKVAIYDQQGVRKEDIHVPHKKAIIIQENGNTVFSGKNWRGKPTWTPKYE